MLEWLGTEGEQLVSAFQTVTPNGVQSFGSPSLHIGGVSDGAKGVQWNASYDPRSHSQVVAVNLEGMQYDGWPISRLILNELRHPRLLEVVEDLTLPQSIVWWRRDHWQAAARPKISEHDIGRVPLESLTEETWRGMLAEALGCLDPKRARQGRATQRVTLSASGKTVEGEVSPHLQILYHPSGYVQWAELIPLAMGHMAELHNWAVSQSQALH